MNDGNTPQVNTNEFIAPVFMKRKRHDFSAWLMLRRTLKRMDKISPDFDTMYKIWEMVNIFHDCYMHTYTEKSNLHLFLGTIVKQYQDSYAMIYKENDFEIKFVLQLRDSDKIINLEINRTASTRNSQCEKITFTDGNAIMEYESDVEKFRFIISCLMNGAKELIKYYYDNKRF